MSIILPVVYFVEVKGAVSDAVFEGIFESFAWHLVGNRPERVDAEGLFHYLAHAVDVLAGVASEHVACLGVCISVVMVLLVNELRYFAQSIRYKIVHAV